MAPRLLANRQLFPAQFFLLFALCAKAGYIAHPVAVGALPTNKDSTANPPEPGKGVRFTSRAAAPFSLLFLS